MALRDPYNVLGAAHGHYFSPVGPGAGPEIDDPIRRLDQVQIVFDHDHGMTHVHKPVQHIQELPDVVTGKARRGLIEDVEFPASFGGLPEAKIPRPTCWSCQRI